MSYEMKKLNGNAHSPVGNANPLRGAGYHTAAIKFIKEFPVGSALSSEQFDEFIIANDLADAPKSVDKGSDGWQAFLQRRFQAKINLNKAGTHPRMLLDGMQPFAIVQLGAGELEVKAPFQAVLSTPIAKDIESLVETKRVALRHLMQSVDYNSLPPSAQSKVQNLSDTIEDFKAQVEFNTVRLSSKFERLRSDVEMLVLEGSVKPMNGGIKQLIESKNDQLIDDVDSVD